MPKSLLASTSASEVAREALRLIKQQDQLRSLQLLQLRHDIQEGLDSGEPTPWNADEIKQDGRKRRSYQSAGAPTRWL
jgi:antitoxin ParD1/3/4